MITTPPITVAQYGLGPIGAETAKLLLRKPWVKLVAAVDIDPAKIGRDLGEIIGIGQKTGIVVTGRLETKPMAVAHTTGSRLKEVAGQLNELLAMGCHVVSTCEELAFPLDQTIREQLQQTARSANVVLLGTGVNPGFVMDKLPLTISSVCQDVRTIDVQRVVDAGKRREPLQRKVGAGMTAAAFDEQVRAGRIKHMGLKESLLLIADGLKLELERVSDEEILPVMADRDITTDYLSVKKGQVAGVHQRIDATAKNGVTIKLDIKMYVGAEHPADRVMIRGIPDVSMEITGGVHGDRATAAMVVNSIPRVFAARPGVLTMDDIPVSYR